MCHDLHSPPPASPPRLPSANAIADISGVARDYNVVYCGAFRSTRLHATYRGKSPMIVSRGSDVPRTNARALQPRRSLILHNARSLPSHSFERWYRERVKKIEYEEEKRFSSRLSNSSLKLLPYYSAPCREKLVKIRTRILFSKCAVQREKYKRMHVCIISFACSDHGKWHAFLPILF